MYRNKTEIVNQNCSVLNCVQYRNSPVIPCEFHFASIKPIAYAT